ncbi:MAG: hypothetical protein Q9198_006177, partial [Flavoplaca austrocitrina]
PRVTPYYSSTAASLSIDGYDKIQGGVTVSSNAYTLHRNPDVFLNPEAWMPERWLEADKERRQEMKRWLWTFSSGGRMCLGSNFAIQSTSAIFARWQPILVASSTILSMAWHGRLLTEYLMTVD